MISDKIRDINIEFISEAKNSPRLFSDMAAMERYMAESYDNRILIELLQNADDALSKRTKLIINNDAIIFANNGRPFEEEDILAICRSGASNKSKTTQIGYRGVGFKSTVSISNNIIIYSNDTYFTFSKDRCAKALHIDINNVPTVRIPFLMNENDISIDLKLLIFELITDGFTTVFAFTNANKKVIEHEIEHFDKTCLLFLRNVESLNIIDQHNQFLYLTKRSKKETGIKVELFANKLIEKWWLPQINELYHFAFKLNEDDKVITCEKEDAVFHSYLPTLENSPYYFKINGNFSTDPSRKHIVLDEDCKKEINNLVNELVIMVNKAIQDINIFSEILVLIENKVSFTPIAIAFHEKLHNKISEVLELKTNSGLTVKVKYYKLIDNYFTVQEKILLRDKSKNFNLLSYKNSNKVFEEFVQYFAKSCYNLEDYILCLSDYEFMNDCVSELKIKIYSYVIKQFRINSLMNNSNYNLGECLIDTNYGLLRISEIITNISVKIEYIELWKLFMTNDEIEWFCKTVKIKKNLFLNNSIKKVINNKVNKNSKYYISKWRSAEQQCIEVEESMGNSAVYVGNKNLGYDVESITAGGEKRYLEVKLISFNNNAFTMTNNEYTAAHKLNYNYYICLVKQGENMMEVTYIKNPIETLNLEKRVRQWEWYCESYEGESYYFNYQ